MLAASLCECNAERKIISMNIPDTLTRRSLSVDRAAARVAQVAQFIKGLS